MKKILAFSLLCCLFIHGKAQINLENSYTASASLTELSLSGYKYYVMDVAANQCRIYNLEHTLWKTIPLSIPTGMYLYDIRFVSETLFNLDSKIELAYTYYSYDTTFLYYTYYTVVLNETGSILLSIPGCGYLDLKQTTSSGTKLLAYVYNYAVLPYTVTTQVYSLPGNLPTGELANGQENPQDAAFPDPAPEGITIPYRLPLGNQKANLEIFNTTGNLMRSVSLDPLMNRITIPLHPAFPNGVYLYRVTTPSGVITTGRFIHS